MLVVDSSALIAVIKQEAYFKSYFHELEQCLGQGIISAVTVLEVSIVSENLLPGGSKIIRSFLTDYKINIMPFTEEIVHHSIHGFLHYGKGRHPAALNLGDCAVYGLAKASDSPILCTGNDFRRTDIRTLQYD